MYQTVCCLQRVQCATCAAWSCTQAIGTGTPNRPARRASCGALRAPARWHAASNAPAAHRASPLSSLNASAAPAAPAPRRAGLQRPRGSPAAPWRVAERSRHARLASPWPLKQHLQRRRARLLRKPPSPRRGHRLARGRPRAPAARRPADPAAGRGAARRRAAPRRTRAAAPPARPARRRSAAMRAAAPPGSAAGPRVAQGTWRRGQIGCD